MTAAAYRGGPAQHGSHARDELARLEGLGHVVISADLEAGDPVDDVVARGEQDDRRPPAGRAQLAQDVEPGAAWEHDVEDDQVGLVVESRSEGGVAVRGIPDLVSFAGEVGPHDLADVGLVVDDQDAAHGGHHRRAGAQCLAARPLVVGQLDGAVLANGHVPFPAPRIMPPRPAPVMPLEPIPAPAMPRIVPLGPAPTAAPRMPPIATW